MANSTKAKYWTGVLYTENMIDAWQTDIGDILQLPYCYCIHDKDKLSDSVEDRKIHVHIIIAFNNTTTYKNAFNTFDRLSAPGKRAINKCEQIINIKQMYDYLIHDTETCRKKGKHLYDKNERIGGNNFDIGAFEQLSQQDKDDMCKHLYDDIVYHQFTNYYDFTVYVMSTYDASYFSIMKVNSGFFERVIRGLYLRKEQERKAFLENEAEKEKKKKKLVARKCETSSTRQLIENKKKPEVV